MTAGPYLFVDVQHGLCNRLRAMASAAAIARNSGRQLVVIWRPDHHCAARLGDLVEFDGPVIEDDASAELFRARAGHVVNHMEIEPQSNFGAPVLDGAEAGFDGDVFVRSAYWLTGTHACAQTALDFLRHLRPTRAVNALVESVPHPNSLAVHVRMASGPGYDHLPHEAPANWPAHRHRELVDWRRKSHVDRFVDRVAELDNAQPVDRLFLAADTAEARDRFVGRFGSRVVTLDCPVFDRSVTQLRYALADLLLLTAARRFLASHYSSFSELAALLARPGRPTEWSGFDF